MQKIIVVLIALSGILSACAGYDFLPYRHYGEQRSVFGNFCPPAQAMKGYC
jgi:hypothetical protein